MPSLISSNEKSILTGIFNNIFETFARQVVVYKESLKTRIPNNSGAFVFGFGDSQGEDSYVYTEVTGVYPAVIRYQDQNLIQNMDISQMISNGEVTIKVKKDCRNFINGGKTEKIVFDERTFFIDGDERKQTFLDSEFYIFKLKSTK